MAPTMQTDSARDELDRYCAALKQELGTSPYWSIRHLVCQIDGDRITVQGTVSSFYIKQIAQSLANKVVGIDCVRSEIDVEPEQPASLGNDD
jgi:BON domain